MNEEASHLPIRVRVRVRVRVNEKASHLPVKASWLLSKLFRRLCHGRVQASSSYRAHNLSDKESVYGSRIRIRI